jgi:hypothetical protein
MERSARYTNFSGISGVIAGTLALIGCWLTYWIDGSVPLKSQATWYIVTWSLVFMLAMTQDFTLAQRKAKRHGQTIFNKATLQVVRAVMPGVFIAFVLSLRAVMIGDWDVIPAIWALGYGAAIYAAGAFCVREVRIFGMIQLITGAIGLFAFNIWAHSLILLGISFGIYHIFFGLWMTRKYGW